MKYFKMSLIFPLLVFVLMQPDGRACTTFQLNHNGLVFTGKNYDWMVEDGLIIVNKRGVKKTALRSGMGVVNDAGKPAVWTSKYGSITFNQYGREAPNGGMNEAGLVVESMGLFENSKYPEPDSRPFLNMNQWKQYQLDTSASVKDVLDSDSRVRILPQQGIHVHYLVSDRKGDCATIEFIDGKMVYHTRETLPHRVLTNNTYAESLEYLKQDKVPDPDQFKSIERFNRTVKMLENYKSGTKKSPVDYSFEILQSNRWSLSKEINGKMWTSNTKWSIVYDIDNRTIFFRTIDNQNIRYIELDAFDFSCKLPVRVLDVNSGLTGNVSKNFVNYTQSMNLNLIKNSFSKTPFIPQFPVDILEGYSKYPDSFACGN